MEKIRLDILDLSQSPLHENIFTLSLGELAGPRHFSIRLGPPEAQAIALALQEKQLERPITHDLFKDVLVKLGYRVREVLITALSNHVFLAQLILGDGETLLTVDARPSDAIAMALRFGAALYIDGALLDEITLYASLSRPTAGALEKGMGQLQDYSTETLNRLLQEVVAQEAYEQAALLRDEINRRNSPQAVS